MRVSDCSADVCSAEIMCRENECSNTVFRQYQMVAIEKAFDDRHAERRVAKNDGYVLLRQLDASEFSDDDLSAGIGFGDSGDIGINIYTIGRQMLRDCAQEAAGDRKSTRLNSSH